MGCVRAAKQAKKLTKLAENCIKVVLFNSTAIELTKQVVTWMTKTEIVSTVIKGTKKAVLDKGERQDGENAVLQEPASGIKATTRTGCAP